MDEVKYPKNSVITKVRYHEFTKQVKCIVEDDTKVEGILASLREIMKFDPDNKRYTPEYGKQVMASRARRAAELGISIQDYKTGRWKKNEERKDTVIAATPENQESA